MISNQESTNEYKNLSQIHNSHDSLEQPISTIDNEDRPNLDLSFGEGSPVKRNSIENLTAIEDFIRKEGHPP